MMGTMTSPGLYFDTDGLHAGLVLPLGGVLIPAGDCANQGRVEEFRTFFSGSAKSRLQRARSYQAST